MRRALHCSGYSMMRIVGRRRSLAVALCFALWILLRLSAWQDLLSACVLPREATQKRTSREDWLDVLGSDDCALCFFGLAKRFDEAVLPSLTRNLLRTNPGCDVFVHTYNMSSTSNPRNDENEEPLFVEQVYALNATQYSFDKEIDFYAAHDVNQYLPLFPKDVGWAYPLSLVNMLMQWHSIERAWNTMESYAKFQRDGKPYTRVGMFRVDVEFDSPIRLHHREDAVSLAIPDFAHHKGGLNDRLAFGPRELVRIWAEERFSNVDNFVAAGGSGLHSERFLKFLLHSHGVDIDFRSDICVRRVRANGRVRTDDCGLPSCAHVLRKRAWLLAACYVLYLASLWWMFRPRVDRYGVTSFHYRTRYHKKVASA